MPWQRTLYIMIFAQLTSSVGFSIMFPFLPRYVEALGSSTGLSLELLAALVFSSQALTMTIASPFWGAVSDRYGRKPMVERAAYSGAITLALMAFVPNAEILVLLRALQGFLTGTVSAGNALVASSTSSTGAGFTSARAMLTRWRSPPDNAVPASPTTVCSPSGRRAVSSSTRASAVAVASASASASGSPTRTLSRIEPSKR